MSPTNTSSFPIGKEVPCAGRNRQRAMISGPSKRGWLGEFGQFLRRCGSNAQPTGSRRYSRLKVCATRNRASVISRRYVASRAFTLIELMIVIAIMLIVMTMSVPLVYKMWHKEALNKAVRDVVEVCSNARSQAILKGVMTEVVFHPADRRLEVSSPPAAPPKPSPSEVWVPVEVETQPPPPPPANSGLSAQLSEKITIQMLDVNLTAYRDAEVARVRFYPNGTCDELNLVLLSDNGQQVGIDLEVTTGLANVVNDINEWLRR